MSGFTSRHCLRPAEWGYELVRAEGHSTSAVEDPDFKSEQAVIAALHRDIDRWERVPGYGWCFVPEQNTAAVGMGR